MLDKFQAIINLFRVGSSVSDPAAWKNGQITTTMLGGFFIAIVQLLKAFGYELPLDVDTSTAIAGGVIAFINWVLTLSTSKHVGLLPAKTIELDSVSSMTILDSVQNTEEIPAIYKNNSQFTEKQRDTSYIN